MIECTWCSIVSITLTLHCINQSICSFFRQKIPDPSVRLLLPSSSTPSPTAVGLPTRLRCCELRIDYCNTSCWCTNNSNGHSDKIQRQLVLKAVARIVTGTWKFDRGLGQILHNELHWLDVRHQVYFKLAMTVHRCLNGRVLPYLSDYCVPVAGADF